MIETKLYLGRSRKSGLAVTDRMLDEFIQRHVSPNFDGFTLYNATGFWKGTTESTVVLELIHDPEDEIRTCVIENIAEAYVIIFDQDAVLRVDRQVDSHLIENQIGKPARVHVQDALEKTDKLDRTDGNFNIHPAFSSILEKAKHNTPWPGQTEVIVTKL